MVNIIFEIIVKVLCFLTVTGALYKICIAIEVTGFSDYILQQKLVMYFVNCFGLWDRKAKALEVWHSTALSQTWLYVVLLLNQQYHVWPH